MVHVTTVLGGALPATNGALPLRCTFLLHTGLSQLLCGQLPTPNTAQHVQYKALKRYIRTCSHLRIIVLSRYCIIVVSRYFIILVSRFHACAEVSDEQPPAQCLVYPSELSSFLV